MFDLTREAADLSAILSPSYQHTWQYIPEEISNILTKKAQWIAVTI